MLTPDTKKNVFWKTGLMVGICLLIVLLAGAVHVLRGPARVMAPLMANVPIQLPDQPPLYVMKYEVTVAEWNRCFADGACHLGLRVRANQDADRTPATGLSYIDVTEYVAWINLVTRSTYRLPTLVEWEGMAASVLPEDPDPIFTDPDLSWASSYILAETSSRVLREQGAFSTTPEGIADLDGSVWEWTQDCYAGGRVVDPDRCPAYFVGGEHIAALSFLERDPARGGCAAGTPPAHLGLRLVRTGRPQDWS